MSVYLYARVSTDRQENSKAAQVDRLLQWAERNGHTVDETFTDEDVSALSVRLQDRPAGKQLWDRLEDRKSTRLNSSHVSESRMPSSA